MSRKNTPWLAILGGALCLSLSCALAIVEVSDLAKKLLYGDQPTRIEAVQEFNKLPAEAQYRMVPDFMVGMTDTNPEVRKIASRILKSMGVKTENQIPDAKTAAPVPPATPSGEDKWAEEKKMKDADTDKWSDLKKMKGEDTGNYTDMKEQFKDQVTLDATQLQANSPDSASPMSTVVDSLKDPDPWVKQQAARRLPFVHPAPMEAIPLLIKMLGDKEPESRRAAAAALGSFGPLAKSAIPALDAALSDPDPGVKEITAEALKLIKQTP